ncbi:hypothetical protein PTI98_007902 [Pleurotus ostreatus]|nr:hypothetical protein PTI98_007902 [Pleurotus ostreatus]
MRCDGRGLHRLQRRDASATHARPNPKTHWQRPPDPTTSSFGIDVFMVLVASALTMFERPLDLSQNFPRTLAGEPSPKGQDLLDLSNGRAVVIGMDINHFSTTDHDTKVKVAL